LPPGEPGDGEARARLLEPVLERLVAGDGEGAWRAVAVARGEGPDTPPPPAWNKLTGFARSFLARLDTGGEIDSVLRGLAGRYIPPSPGGEPGRRPEVLPTGRNLHALDPQRIPSPVA